MVHALLRSAAEYSSLRTDCLVPHTRRLALLVLVLILDGLRVAVGHAANHGRRLTQDVIPPATYLRVVQEDSTEVVCNPEALCPGARLFAGLTYTRLDLVAPLATDWNNAGAAKVKLVPSSVSRIQAQAGDCQTSGLTAAELGVTGVMTASPWLDAAGVDTSVASEVLSAEEPFTFKMGGIYYICYSSDGTFGAGTSDLFMGPGASPMELRVNGVYDETCALDGAAADCLSSRPYYCYLRRDAFNSPSGSYSNTTSCVVALNAAGQGYNGPVGTASWTPAFTAATYDTDTGAMLTAGTPASCGTSTAPAEFICSDGGACDAGDPLLDVETSQLQDGQGTITVTVARGDLVGNSGARGFLPQSVAMCYCPDFDNCGTDYTRYMQQVGVLYYFLSKICHRGDATCTNDYVGVTPHYQFRIRVECPSGVCAPDLQSRMKLVQSVPENELPSWDAGNGCASGMHGFVDGAFRLPELMYVPFDGTASGIVNPANCESTLNCQLAPDAAREDYREFGGTFGFNYTMGLTVFEDRGFAETKHIDVCYCNADCGVPTSWFKVGAFNLAPTQLVSAATGQSNDRTQFAVEYVNQPGMLGFQRTFANEGVLGLGEFSVIKILADPGRVLRDVDCQVQDTSSTLVAGPSDPVAASLNHLGRPQTGPPIDLQKIVFNSDSFTNTITVSEPGTIAVCYCAVTLDNACIETVGTQNWKLMTHLTVKGPIMNQRWFFSTDVVFRFEYEGYGLSDQDSLRIISSDGECTDNNNNPDTAQFADTGIRVKCPEPCSDVTDVAGAEPGDLPTMTLSDATYSCDENFQNCGTNDIRAIEVVNEQETELMFAHPPGLQVGDVITLGEQIECDPMSWCTASTLAALQGKYTFADSLDNNPAAPDNYMHGHRITQIMEDPRRLRIAIGWPQPVPVFRIIFLDQERLSLLGLIGKAGAWTLHSRAMTREEVMGMEEKANLKVCWKYGGSGAKFVQEIGRITIRRPAQLTGATVSLTTTLREQLAPVILNFKTASGVAGDRYDAATDSLRLKIVFLEPRLFDIYYTTEEAIPALVETDDTIVEARQSVCGKLFRELWSDDISRGFPLPVGCYYVSYTDGNGGIARRELFMRFDGLNGLRRDSTYQIVFNAVAHDLGTDAGPNDIVTDGNDYMQLFVMDDYTARPYEAIESGLVALHGQPQVGTAVPEDPRFRMEEPGGTGGVKILGGTGGLLQMYSGDSLLMQIMGDNTTGAIRAGQYLRFYLWPLTQWQTTASCLAECVTDAEQSFVCGTITECRGSAIVAGGTLNSLRIQIPAGQDEFDPLGLFGNKKMRLRIGGITAPSGGFFAGRIGAQVTKEADVNPHYVVSSGDFLWKAPTEGHPTSMLVATIGGGNERPFRGDTHNTVYARILLSSTLYTQALIDSTGSSASFTITLPQEYTCVDMTTDTAYVADNNTWKAESTLPVFRGENPQGRGTPDDGTTPSHGWSVENGNQCTFTPEHPYGAIYAGSSMYVKITVNNPTRALPRTDPANVWTISYRSKGMHWEVQPTPEYPFLVSGDEYFQPNLAVLGIITDAVLQPTRFDPSERRAVDQDLRYFFRPEQEVGAGGSIRVTAPQGFDFGTTSCMAMDLDDAYYAIGAVPLHATLRLPGIVSCTTSASETDGTMNVAHIQMSNILLAGRLYAFKIHITNPSEYDPSQLSGWTLLTADASGYSLDGTPTSIPFIHGDDNSWGVYPGALMFSVNVMDLRPYSMTQTRTYLQVLLTQVPTGTVTGVRFVAPPGYIWEFEPDEFVYRTQIDEMENGPLVPQGVSAAFPSGIPLTPDGSSTLRWPVMAAEFDSTFQYGFAAPVRVPDLEPTSTSNAFYLELGYGSVDATGRLAAQTVEGPSVQALRNAHVGYSTNIKGKENTLQLQLETTTTVPENGGLEIVGPEGFRFTEPCEILAVNDPAAPMPPPFVECTTSVDMNAAPTGLPVMRLRVGAGGLSPQILRFAVLADNPEDAVVNYYVPPSEGVTPCGTSLCWLFQTLSDVRDAQRPSAVGLDYRIYAQGFSVNEKMLEAIIPILSVAERLGTGRDDRPLQSNSVIFAFRLTSDLIGSGNLVIRGPYGYVFAEECLTGVHTSEETVFGIGNRFPEDYTQWPGTVSVTGCRGHDRTANLTLEVDSGYIMFSDQLYAIRVALTANPTATPSPNQWTIELNHESSEPIEGITLWTFTSTAITPSSTARDRASVTGISTRNSLSIAFRPFNSIEQYGQLWMQAPEGFVFVALPSRECSVELRELPYTEFGLQYPGFTWPADDLVCLVDPNDPALLSVSLRNERTLSAGRDHAMVLMVFNPRLISAENGATQWMLSSYTPSLTPLDQTLITSFTLNSAMNEWSYLNQDSSGQQVTNGGTDLPDFRLIMRFADELIAGDRIVITAPAENDDEDEGNDFLLRHPISGSCLPLMWIPDDGVANWREPLLSQAPFCDRSSLTLFIDEPLPGLPLDYLLQLKLNISNPLRTPPNSQNYWRCVHYRTVDGSEVIMSSSAFESWTIIPQLENVEVDLLGPLLAAESLSTIRFTFTVVSPADDIEITASHPPGFDFGQAIPQNSDHSVILANGNNIRIALSLETGARVSITLAGVFLGIEGGETEFSLTTWRGGLLQAGMWNPGTRQDEKLNFRDGFRLPGRFLTRNPVLYNDYSLNPLLYEVESDWFPQMGRPVYVRFPFEITQSANAGDTLVVMAPPYHLTVRQIDLYRTDAPDELLPMTIRFVLRSELQVRLEQPLEAYVSYTLIVTGIAPTAAEALGFGAPIMWRLEIRDEAPPVLPVATNDGDSREFAIVEEYPFQVTATHVPPGAEVEVDLLVDTGTLRSPGATELRVVAPPGFNFTANCLVDGGPSITDCQPGFPLSNGRLTAYLTCIPGGLTGPPGRVRIRTITPQNILSIREWFVQGVNAFSEEVYGWGRAAGITIENMVDTSVVYPGIPNIPATMVWQFRTRTLVQAGGYLHVELARDFFPDCSTANFEAVALPSAGGCERIGDFDFRVMLNSTIPRGEYVFALPVTPPLATPLWNYHSITLHAPDGSVIDSARDLPGPEIQDKLQISELSLSWTESRAEWESTVTIGFEVIEQLPDLIVAADQQVGEILITFPSGFVHNVESAQDFTIVNEEMPLFGGSNGDWLDFVQQDRLRVILDLNGTTWQTLRAGQYTFRFPVTVPATMPVYNVWFLSLCRPNYGGCSRRSDPAVLITFANLGFAIDESPPAVAAATAPRVPMQRLLLSFLYMIVMTSLSLWLSE